MLWLGRTSLLSLSTPNAHTPPPSPPAARELSNTYMHFDTASKIHSFCQTFFVVQLLQLFYTRKPHVATLDVAIQCMLTRMASMDLAMARGSSRMAGNSRLSSSIRSMQC
jgi:hypothetical protein